MIGIVINNVIYVIIESNHFLDDFVPDLTDLATWLDFCDYESLGAY